MVLSVDFNSSEQSLVIFVFYLDQMRVCLFLRLLLSASERETDVHRLIYLSNSNAVFFFQNCTHYYFEFNFCKVIRVDNAYNQIQVRPDYNK